VLNAEAYMLFYKKGVTLAKVAQDDGSIVRPLSASSECDFHFLLFASVHRCNQSQIFG